MMPDGTEVNLYDLLYDLSPSLDEDKYEIRVQDGGIWIVERDTGDDDVFYGQFGTDD